MSIQSIIIDVAAGVALYYLVIFLIDSIKKKDVPVVSGKKKRVFTKIGKYRTTENACFFRGFQNLYELLKSHNDDAIFKYQLSTENVYGYCFNKFTLELTLISGNISNSIDFSAQYRIEFDEYYCGTIDFFTKHLQRFFKANGYKLSCGMITKIQKKNKTDKNG